MSDTASATLPRPALAKPLNLLGAEQAGRREEVILAAHNLTKALDLLHEKTMGSHCRTVLKALRLRLNGIHQRYEDS